MVPGWKIGVHRLSKPGCIQLLFAEAIAAIFFLLASASSLLSLPQEVPIRPNLIIERKDTEEMKKTI